MHIYDKASDILRTKSGPLWSVPPEATVYDALKLIASKDIGALLVMKDSKLLGVFSEREYARSVALQGRSSHDTGVAELMLAPALTIAPDTSIDEAMRLMTEHHVRHLPVMRGDVLVGIISIGDLVKWIITVQERTIEHLQSYITGQYDTIFVSA